MGDSFFDDSSDELEYRSHKVSHGDEKLTEYDPENPIGALHELRSMRSQPEHLHSESAQYENQRNLSSLTMQDSK